MKIKTVHITSLQMYENCPHCWYLENVVGVEKPKSPELDLGTKVHKAIEKWHKTGRKVLTMPEAPFLKAYIKHYGENYWNEDSQLLEHKFEIELKNPVTDAPSGVLFAGTIDRVVDNWLFDHKTSKSNWSQEKADSDLQASGYYLAHYLLTGKLADGFTFNVLVKNKTKVCRPVTTYREMNDLELVFERMMRSIKNIESENFKPNYKAWWHRYSICPAKGT